MTLLAPSAPVVLVAHEWASPVERVRATPTAIITTRDGGEQRIALSHLATDTITYRLVAPAMGDALLLRALVESATDRVVRMPRWEDQTRVDTAVTSGTAVSVPCDTVDRPTFVVGQEVILWRSASSYEVTTLGAVTATDFMADLTSGWAAGTIVAPITEARVVLPLALSHWAPTSGALTFAVECTLTDLAGVGTGGGSVTGVPSAISILEDIDVTPGGRSPMVAVVTDAAGEELPGNGIVWSTNDATNAPVWSSPDPLIAMVANPNRLQSGFATITATLGALSASGAARYSG